MNQERPVNCDCIPEGLCRDQWEPHCLLQGATAICSVLYVYIEQSVCIQMVVSAAGYFIRGTGKKYINLAIYM